MLIVALLLLVIAAYNLVSYIRDRRQSGLPTKKIKAIARHARDNIVRIGRKRFAHCNFIRDI